MEIQGYTIEKEIGHGGMATVYLAVQKALERRVALKVMNPALTTDPDFTSRFLREGPIAARLNDPQIVTIYDTGVDNNQYYLAMEYLSGGTLKQKIRQGLPVEQALTVAKLLGSALGYAHSRNVLHRDFKPHNILFRDTGTPVLTDFGIAKAVGGNTQMTVPGTSIGSPMYMSPEQATGKMLDARSDIYSLGIVFYEMLTGKPPYQAKDSFALALMHINEPIPKLPQELEGFQPIINTLLAKNPDDRFKIAEQFVEALKDAERAYYITLPPQSTNEINSQSTLIIPEQHVDSPLGSTTESSALPGKQPIGKKGYWLATGISLAAIVAALSLAYFLFVPKDNLGTLLNEAERLKQQGELEASLDKIQQGLETQSNHPGFKRLLDEVQALQQQPTDAERQLVKAQALFDEDKLLASLAAIEEGLRLAPENPDLQALQTNINQLLAEREQQQAIAQLLEQAQAQVEKEQFVEPENDNAHSSYMQILELDKDNTDALAGIAAIANELLARAETSKQTGTLDQTIKYINQGLMVAPDNEALTTLRKDMQEDAERLENAQQAYAKARQLLQAGDFTASLSEIDKGLANYPDYDKLLELRQQTEQKQAEAERFAKLATDIEQAQQLQAQGQYQQSLDLIEQNLQLVPQNGQLIALREQAITALEKQAAAARFTQLLNDAQRLKQSGELAASLDLVNQGLQQAPADSALLTLQNELQTALTQRQQLQQLLANAAQQLERKQLTTPAGNNALESYQQALLLNPDSAEAQQGLDNIALAYLELAEQEQVLGKIRKSQSFVEKGLSIRPEHPELLALQAYFIAEQAFRADAFSESFTGRREGFSRSP